MAMPSRRGFLFVASCTIVGVAQSEVIKGVSYGPVPLKSAGGAAEVPSDDWFCDEAVPMWGDAGRGDLAVMQSLGANMVRLYGNNPENDHTNFLDEAFAHGLSVAPGMSDYPYYQQVPGSCLHSTEFDCFTQVRPLYLKNLQKGFLNMTNFYHPALKYMNIVNEPDLKIPSDADTGDLEELYRMCRAIVSAFDGMLEAEKEAGVTGPLINFTATFSFAICGSCEFSHGKPALAQMAQLDDAMRHPEKYNYTPRNNVTAAYEARFTHSFNTANPAEDVKLQFLDAYEEVFPSTPVYIAEYHRVGANQTQDLGQILQMAESSLLFLGVSFFQFQVAYWKAGSEMAFGMFGLGDDVLTSMPYFSKTYDVHCLQPMDSLASGVTLPDAMAQVYGGPGVDNATLCSAHPGGVRLNQAGYVQIALQQSVPQMSQFVERLIHHMGGTVKTGQHRQLTSFAEKTSGDTSNGAFVNMADFIGSRPDWVDFDPEARCVADRNAHPNVVGSAIAWVCSQGVVDCATLPPQCKSSTYRFGDYVFSRFAQEPEGTSNPLVKCWLGGAALFAPSKLYRRWTGADLCVEGGATTTSWTSVTTTTTSATTTTTDLVSTTTTNFVQVTTQTSREGTTKHKDFSSSTSSKEFLSAAHQKFPQHWTLCASLGLLAVVAGRQ